MPYSVIMDVLSHALSSEETQMLMHPNVAGVLLFTRNVLHREQLLQLTQSIHSHRPDVMIMIDHEGGNVQRIQRMGFTPLMSAGWHGRIFDQDQNTGLAIAKQAGQIMAQELLACGIDLSLAPILDVHHDDSKIIGQLDRSFHKNPDSIIQLARAYIQGMHQAGMPAVGKHFPGHGSCLGDSHIELPHNHKTAQELRDTDLKPFIELIRDKTLDGVMPAHVVYPAIDHHAAGYSSRWLRDILREELHFDGIVMSDCLGMKGADIGDLNTRAKQALTAGCDLLIVANQTRETLAAFIEQLDDSDSSHRVARVTKFKKKIKRPTTPSKHHSSSYETLPLHHDPLNPTQQV